MVSLLLLLRPRPNLSVLVKLDVNHVGSAANGAVLDVFLDGSRRQVDGDDDFFTAPITNVACFVFHFSPQRKSLDHDFTSPRGPPYNGITIMVHQILSERRFFAQFVGTEEPPVEELLPPWDKPIKAKSQPMPGLHFLIDDVPAHLDNSKVSLETGRGRSSHLQRGNS